MVREMLAAKNLSALFVITHQANNFIGTGHKVCCTFSLNKKNLWTERRASSATLLNVCLTVKLLLQARFAG